MNSKKFFIAVPGVIITTIIILLASGLTAQPSGEQDVQDQTGDDMAETTKKIDLPENYETATLGGGCFWCVEAVYEPIDGVYGVVSGYSGGETENPTYASIGTGTTGHAEVVQVYFDPGKVSYEQIIQIFFIAHDPTTLNRQGYDVGTQYRSIILTHSDSQKQVAENVMADAQEEWNNSIVTEIKPFSVFYVAEEYHQDFYENNPNYGYCAAVIRPKMQKLGLEGVERIDVLELDL